MWQAACKQIFVPCQSSIVRGVETLDKRTFTEDEPPGLGAIRQACGRHDVPYVHTHMLWKSCFFLLKSHANSHAEQWLALSRFYLNPMVFRTSSMRSVPFGLFSRVNQSRRQSAFILQFFSIRLQRDNAWHSQPLPLKCYVAILTIWYKREPRETLHSLKNAVSVVTIAGCLLLYGLLDDRQLAFPNTV